MVKWHRTQTGRGLVTQAAATWHLSLPPAARSRYHDAQISSYARPGRFALQPPLSITLTAWRSGGDIRGTAGFGLWNHPFAPGEVSARLPRAAWFFYGSPPNDMPLALDVPGYGWKCAVMDAANAAFLSLLPTAPVGFLLMRQPSLYRRLWPVAQRALKVAEHHLGDDIPAQRHRYRIDWLADAVLFRLNDTTIFETRLSPRGSLGFIAWVDNQYAVVTPQGRFGFGLLDVPHAVGLGLADLAITSGGR